MTETLTENQHRVLQVLKEAATPMSAYSILEALHGKGIRAPLQVYRALNVLIDAGYVHRLESVNSFVICARQHHLGRALTVFTICDDCGRVDEADNAKLDNAINEVTDQIKFQSRHSTIEIRGVCCKCAAR